jgi:hypothetical protein
MADTSLLNNVHRPLSLWSIFKIDQSQGYGVFNPVHSAGHLH